MISGRLILETIGLRKLFCPGRHEMLYFPHTSRKVLAVVSDFDQTLADTGQTSTAISGVEEACGIAMAEIFGEAGAFWFARVGLQNRAPAELVQAALKELPSSCIETLYQYFKRARVSIAAELVPEGKGVELMWDRSDLLPIATELFVRAKLGVLYKQISPEWPRPCGDAKMFLQYLARHQISRAILSSGHEMFVQKTFDMWGVSTPPMLTDDDLRGLPNAAVWVKPNPLLFEKLLTVWGRSDERVYGYDRGSFLYIGDDPVRDGQLALQSGAHFALYDPTGKKRTSYPELYAFSDWRTLLADMSREPD